jgi:hypothetical protein
MLAIFSNPPDQSRLRLDKEDKTLMQIARTFHETVTIERLHASEIDDINSLIMDGSFDVIQFSGHGHHHGICLEKSHCEAGATEYVSAERVVEILELASKPPLLTVFLCCYSDESLSILADAAPFVITSMSEITDDECVAFVSGFYEHLFRETAIERAFEQAIRLLTIRGIPAGHFRLSRRSLVKKGDSLYVESRPVIHKDSILVNLDQVKGQLGQLGLPEEELCYLLAKKLRVHYWIFERARDSATIPIGRELFGEFQWSNAKDIVYCTRIVKFRHDVPQVRWEVWAKVLTTYNDLASCEYRTAEHPAAPNSRFMLERAVHLFSRYVPDCLVPLRSKLRKMRCRGLSAHIEFAIAETERAARELEWERYPQVVEALELALTNYHEIVRALQPVEEQHESH